jgi:ATP-binding protein involved in chromosome partitioning
MGKKTTVTKEDVLAALRKVLDPELKKDLVSLDMIKDLQVENDKVRFQIQLTTPACPMRSKIEADARKAVEVIAGVSEVEIEFSANVPKDSRIGEKGIKSMRNTIAIASGKGGVGKSTVAVNIAVALAKTGAKVGLLDADIYGPNIPTMMGVDTMPTPQGGKMIPAESYGVKIMSIGFLVQPNQPIIWRGPMLHSAIQQFITDVAWGDLDYLIVDLPPGTGDAQLSLAQSVPLSGGVIVTLPQNVSLEDARRGLEMFRTMDIPILGIVENMSYLEMPDGTRVDVFGYGGGKKLAGETGVDLIGEVPMDPIVRKSGDSGKPVVLENPESDAAKAFIVVAKKIAAKISVLAMEGKKHIPLEIVD